MSQILQQPTCAMPRFVYRVRRFTAALVACCTVSFATPLSAELDLSRGPDNLQAFGKIRADIAGKDSVSWFAGTLFIKFPKQKPVPIMKFEGFNNARMVPQEDGSYQFLSREVMLYKDLKTGAVLETWDNPYTKQTNHVIHVHNDPVNHHMKPGSKEKPRIYPWTVMGDDISLLVDVPLAYPNPLPPAEYGDYSSGEMYVGSEHFGFFAKLDDVHNKNMTAVPMTLSWFRSGPLLPWMEMGQQPAILLYSGTGKKLLGGVDELPQTLHDYTKKHFPKYLSAPQKWSKPNETSWTVFKRILDQRREAGAQK